MGWFGRPTPEEEARKASFAVWVRGLTPYALPSLLLGVLSVLDAFTVVIGLASGVGAIVCGSLGRRDLRARPELQGERFCKLAIALGALGIVLSLTFLLIIWPMVASRG